MNPTPYRDLNEVLRQMTAGIREALGEVFTGAYLQGSFAVGDFDEHSDVDFIVVAARELSEGEVEALNGLHASIYGLACSWAQHLEGSYFPESVLRSCDRRGEKLWYLEHGDQELTRSEHCNTAVVRWVVRERGVALAGPPADTLVESVPVDLLRREIRETICDWGREILAEPERFSNHFYQTFILLSYCRMLHDIETGRVGSKREGAEWAKEKLDRSWSELIDRAWDGRPDPAASVRRPADPSDFARTLELVRDAIDRIAPTLK